MLKVEQYSAKESKKEYNSINIYDNYRKIENIFCIRYWNYTKNFKSVNKCKLVVIYESKSKQINVCWRK